MNLEYVDIFYTHRYDPNTPLEETLQTLVDIVRQGKALYIGISKYPKDKAELAYKYLKELKRLSFLEANRCLILKEWR